jgi:hypothetical protein
MTDALRQLLTAFTAAWLVLPLVALAVGYVIGLLHFRSLEGVVRRVISGDISAVLLQIVRLAGLGVVLWLFALIGASVLLAGAVGVLLARARVLVRYRRAP